MNGQGRVSGEKWRSWPQVGVGAPAALGGRQEAGWGATEESLNWVAEVRGRYML